MPKQNKKATPTKKANQPKPQPLAATVKNPPKTSALIFPGKTW